MKKNSNAFLNRHRSFVCVLFLSLSSVHGISQNCSGNACGSLSFESVPDNLGGSMPYFRTDIKNKGTKPVVINVKVQVWMDCSQAQHTTLQPGKVISFVQPPCEVVANYEVVAPAPTAPKPNQPPKPLEVTVVKPKPEIVEGNYRIRNLASGEYLFLMLDSVALKKVDLFCSHVTKEKWEAAKWHITDRTDLNFENGKTDIRNKYQLSSKLNGFSVGRSSCATPNNCGYSAIYPSKYNSTVKSPDYQIVTWEFVKKPGENTYQIKTPNHFFYLNAENSLVTCEEILGDPKSAQWVLEMCE